MIKKLLDGIKIPYEVSEHEPVCTLEQAAKVRRVELGTGVRVLVLKTEEENFIMGC